MASRAPPQPPPTSGLAGRAVVPPSPRIKAGEYRSTASSQEYLALSHSELGQIWQREVGPLTDRRGGALTPRLAWSGDVAGGAPSSSDDGSDVGGLRGGNGSPWAFKPPPPPGVELALTSVVSLAATAEGGIVRRVIF